jgi:hypothetical protein
MRPAALDPLRCGSTAWQHQNIATEDVRTR